MGMDDEIREFGWMGFVDRRPGRRYLGGIGRSVVKVFFRMALYITL
jgi:hypothetical protein